MQCHLLPLPFHAAVWSVHKASFSCQPQSEAAGCQAQPGDGLQQQTPELPAQREGQEQLEQQLWWESTAKETGLCMVKSGNSPLHKAVMVKTVCPGPSDT